jgi:hypothetical protein
MLYQMFCRATTDARPKASLNLPQPRHCTFKMTTVNQTKGSDHCSEQHRFANEQPLLKGS